MPYPRNEWSIQMLHSGLQMPQSKSEVCALLEALGVHQAQGLLSRLCNCNQELWGREGALLTSRCYSVDTQFATP